MNDLNDIFNLSIDDFKESEKKSSSAALFKPEASAGRDGVYKAVIRFLPWHKDVKKSIMKKWSTWLVNPATGSGKIVDCPSTIGKKSIIQELYWKFKKSNSVAEQKIAENFSRREKHASLVQIIKDDNNPGNVGKIMVWSYGSKIYNKIQAELKPEYGKPHNPFDLFEGKPFIVNVSKVAGYNNYDNCKFADEKTPIEINGSVMKKDEKSNKIIIDYLTNESPDLSIYDYQEWNEDTEKFVQEVIANVVPGGRVQNEIENSNRNGSANVKVQVEQKYTEKNTDAPKSNFDFEEDFDSDFDDELYNSL